MNNRERRLRQRIDQLADQRDEYRQQLETTRHVRDKLRTRVYELERSRNLWKLRARQWRPLRPRARP